MDISFFGLHLLVFLTLVDGAAFIPYDILSRLCLIAILYSLASSSPVIPNSRSTSNLVLCPACFIKGGSQIDKKRKRSSSVPTQLNW